MNSFNLLVKSGLLVVVLWVTCLSWFFDYSLIMEAYSTSFSPEVVMTISLLFALVLSSGRVMSYFGVAIAEGWVLKGVCLVTSILLALISFGASLVFIANSLVSPNLDEAIRVAKSDIRLSYEELFNDLAEEEKRELDAIVSAYVEREKTIRSSIEPQITQFDDELAKQSKRVYVSGPNKGSSVGPATRALLELKSLEMDKLTAALAFLAQQRSRDLGDLSGNYSTQRSELLAEKNEALAAITAESVSGSQAASSPAFFSLTKLLKNMGFGVSYDVVITCISAAFALILELLFFVAVYFAAARILRTDSQPAQLIAISHEDSNRGDEIIFQNAAAKHV